MRLFNNMLIQLRDEEDANESLGAVAANFIAAALCVTNDVVDSLSGNTKQVNLLFCT